MTQDNDTIDDSATDESGESAVLNGLRKELRAIQKELKSRPDRDSMRTELKAELAGDSTIETLLEGFGHPKGMLDTIKGKLGESEATAETVAAALASTGYSVEVEGAVSTDIESVKSETETELAKVSRLSAEVQATAKKGTTVDVTDQIAAADTQEEVNTIMAKAGLLEDYGY